jgi:hypothetical protein
MGCKGEMRLNICEMVCKSGGVISSSFVLLGPPRGGLANMKTIHAVFTLCYSHTQDAFTGIKARFITH